MAKPTPCPQPCVNVFAHLSLRRDVVDIRGTRTGGYNYRKRERLGAIAFHNPRNILRDLLFCPACHGAEARPRKYALKNLRTALDRRKLPRFLYCTHLVKHGKNMICRD